MIEIVVTQHLGAAAILATAILSSLAYRSPRLCYTSGKDTLIRSPRMFRFIYRYVQVSTLAAAVGAMYLGSPWLLKIPRPGWLSFIGFLLTLTALALFLHAKAALGDAYSPCFDSFVPAKVVISGVYRYIRHPGREKVTTTKSR